MKISTIKLITCNLALATGLAMLAGCASHSYDKGAETANSLQAAAQATTDLSGSMNNVLAALNTLTFKSTGDLRKEFDAFVSASKDLDSSIANLNTKADAMKEKAQVYINNWTNTLTAITSPELRQRSTERKDAVAAELKEMTTHYQAVKKSLVPFQADLKDIQTYLSVDLTPTGVDTIKGNVSKTKVDAVPLRDSIKDLQASFTSLSDTLSPVTSAPASK